MTLSLVLLLGLPCFATLSAAELCDCFPDAGAKWTWDSTTADGSGNGHDLVSGTVAFDTGDFAVGTASASFNGTSHELRYSDGNWMNDAFDQVSYGFWLKPQSLSPASAQTLLDEGGSTNGIYAELTPAGRIRVMVQESHTIFTVADFAFPADGAWHHLGLVYDLGEVEVFFDGSSLGTTSTGFGTMNAHSSDGGFGNTFGGNAGDTTAGRYQGKLDEAFRTLGVVSAETFENYVLDQLRDHGDAPESYGESGHEVAGSPGLYLGSVAPDVECVARTSSDARGDDEFETDDEDASVDFPVLELSPGDTYSVTVPLVNSSASAGTLCGWVDFDLAGQPGEGSFEADEGVCLAVAPGATSVDLDFLVPGDFVAEEGKASFARFSITHDPQTTSDATGDFSDGETEDKRIPINTFTTPTEASFDACGLGGSEGQWSLDGSSDDSSGNGHHLVSGSVSFDGNDFVLGGGSAVFNGTTNFLQFSDGSWMNDAFDEVTLGVWLKPDSLSPASAQTLIDEGGTVNGIYAELTPAGEIRVFVQENNVLFTPATFAFPSDGDWHHLAISYDLGEVEVFFDGVLVGSASTGFGTMSAHSSAGGFGASLGGNSGDTSAGPYQGKMDEAFRALRAFSADDLAEYFACVGDKDFSDAPVSYGIAAHRTQGGSGNLHLGSLAPDRENARAPGSEIADGDDSHETDDEDGVPFFVPGEVGPGDFFGVEVEVVNTTGADAQLCGWMDFDLDGGSGDGTFESDEFACTTVASGATEALVGFTVPADFVFVSGEATYARFRIQSQAMVASDFEGILGRGEVEDYQVPLDTLTPINLVQFKALGSPEGGVQIEWTTLAEISNRGFEVSFATSPKGPYQAIPEGFVPGQGSKLAPTDYAISHLEAPTQGPLYYRLTEVSIAGKKKHHGPVAVDRDRDGLTFRQEAALGLSDFDPEDVLADPDLDGASIGEEVILGRDPYRPDAPEYDPSQIESETIGARFQAEDESPLRWIDEASGPILELNLPRPSFEKIWVEGQPTQRPYYPGILHGVELDPSRPMLPFLGELLPRSFDRVEVLEVQSTSLAGIQVPPGPDPKPSSSSENTPPRFRAGSRKDTPGPWPREIAWLEGSSQDPRIRLAPVSWDSTTGVLTIRTKVRLRLVPGPSVSAQALRAPLVRSVSSLPPGEVYRIRVKGAGRVRLSIPELQAKGLDLAGVQAVEVGLFHRGRPLPSRWMGPEAGVLGAEHALEFFAPAWEDRYAEGLGFHLVVGAPGAQLLRVPLELPPEGSPPRASFLATETKVFRETYHSVLPGDPSEDRFVAGFGRQPTVPPIPGFAPSRASFSLTLPRRDLESPEALEVRLRYGTHEDHPLSPDHHHRLDVGGVVVQDESWSGKGFHTARAQVPPELFEEGATEIGLEASLEGLPPSTRGDQFLPSELSVIYPRLPILEGGWLELLAPAGEGHYSVRGFDPEALRVVETTQPFSPQEFLPKILRDEKGQARFVLPQDPRFTRRWWIFEDSVRVDPERIEIRPVSRLTLSALGARWVALAPDGWEGSLEALRAHRVAEGISASVVSVEDIADEFFAGVLHPQAIRNFVRFARELSPPLEYLLLASDTHMNPRAYPGDWDLWRPQASVGVPAPLVVAGEGLAASETGDDTWYVRESLRSQREASVGRLPARSPEELSQMASKIVAYEVGPGEFSHRILSVSEASEAVFRAKADAKKSLLPEGMAFARLDPGEVENLDLFRSNLNGALNEGAALVQYVGHGSFDFWGNDLLLASEGAQALSGSKNLPVFLSMTCWDNHFVALSHFSMEGLGETLLRNPQGGAVAYFGAGVQSSVLAKDSIHEASLKALLQGSTRRIGPALLAGIHQVLGHSPDSASVVAGFHLLGDPATKLQLAIPERVRGLSGRLTRRNRVQLNWPASEDPSVTHYQVFRKVAAEAEELLAEVSTPSFQDRGFRRRELRQGKGTRRYWVRAVGPRGLRSLPSQVLRVEADSRRDVRFEEDPAQALLASPRAQGGCAAGGESRGIPGLFLAWLILLGARRARVRQRE